MHVVRHVNTEHVQKPVGSAEVVPFESVEREIDNEETPVRRDGRYGRDVLLSDGVEDAGLQLERRRVRLVVGVFREPTAEEKNTLHLI